MLVVGFPQVRVVKWTALSSRAFQWLKEYSLYFAILGFNHLVTSKTRFKRAQLSVNNTQLNLPVNILPTLTPTDLEADFQVLAQRVKGLTEGRVPAMDHMVVVQYFNVVDSGPSR